MILKRKTLGRIIAVGALTIALYAVTFAPFQSVFSPLGGAAERTVVIDAGHGGEDGGAVAADGTVESGINLSVAKRLSALLQFLGCEVKMTRSGDVSLHSPDAQTLRQKKTSDLKNRVKFINTQEDAVLISVHQNSLPSDRSVRGAQSFYAKTDGSDALAEYVQSALNIAVNDREKSKKAIHPGVYLMENVDCTAVLVECGFLSNDAESRLLTTAEHQLKLALTIAGGYLAWETER